MVESADPSARRRVRSGALICYNQLTQIHTLRNTQNKQTPRLHTLRNSRNTPTPRLPDYQTPTFSENQILLWGIQCVAQAQLNSSLMPLCLLTYHTYLLTIPYGIFLYSTEFCSSPILPLPPILRVGT